MGSIIYFITQLYIIMILMNIQLICEYFPEYFFSNIPIEICLTNLINDIPMNDLVEICMYHSVWLHNFYHKLFEISKC